jgi:orotidine-5'-phosphate decarboxylase
MQLTARERLVLALDVDDFKKADKLVGKLGDYVGVFKIGSQLFTSEGTKVVNMVNEKGGKVFLDLKFHDIPNTVARAAEVATKLGVYIFNVHTSGGYEMMKAAAEASKKISLDLGVIKPLILGVTLLTSINQEILEKEIGIKKRLEEQVVHLAKLACGEDFIILTPGIRPAGKSSDDQKRVMTPREAIKLGADFLVIGRPIRNASNPVEAAKKILREMEGN